ncbi:hypothetical protein BCR34DRAFT_606365 [Clohesyomyces aquaticus]|uniref:Transmembrane protein n=1 Tax=Clohesyomyces aquaticus TaxID=1231657 RepID=A0A1Y1YQ65_9PLEO|nr:hypothetical protein BCR34DRAFT_606365 [Clohesyomyces aquaticus]
MEHDNAVETCPFEKPADPELGPDTLSVEEENGTGTVSPWHEFIRNFSSLWFTIALDAGVLSIIMHVLPYQFRGLPVLSTIMFVFTLVIYATVWTCFLSRWVKYFAETRRRIFNDAEEVALLGAPIVAYFTVFTIVGQVALTCSEAWGYRLTVFAVSAYRWCHDGFFDWRNCLQQRGRLDGPHGFAVIVVSYLCLGYALFLALAIYAAYLHRLIVVGWPPAEKIPGMILTIGPMGQSATALQLLATATD